MNLKITKARNPLAEAFAKSIQSLESQVEIRKLSIVEELLQFMKREGISRSELAGRMGVGPSRITKMLSGDENLTIDTLVRAGHAVGADLAQTFVPQGQKGHWTAHPKMRPTKGNCVKVDFSPKQIAKAPTPKLSSQKTADHDAEDAA
jgi:transcriptional regulator with XRE-family HTH domain